MFVLSLYWKVCHGLERQEFFDLKGAEAVLGVVLLR